MCELAKSQRRTYRDQDPPRIRNRSRENLLRDECETSKSTPNSPTALPQRGPGLEKCLSDPDFFERQQKQLKREESIGATSAGRCLERRYQQHHHHRGSTGSSRENNASGEPEEATSAVVGAGGGGSRADDFPSELVVEVPSSRRIGKEVVTNGLRSDPDSCDGLTNGREMAPVLGVPPPPPAPHMGPDGLVLPRKPYNPCLTSGNHKDLRRELLFNQKVGKSVLNQKSELQRALERHREAVSRREAERSREEFYKDDPRTALQRAIEQRAKHIRLAEQPQPAEPPNPLITARAKLRTRTDSQ